jgi:ribonuclease HI
MSLKLVFILALEKEITQLQIFGDSLLVIQWMKGDYMLRNFLLQPLFSDIKNLQSTFSHISFSHVYRDKNIEADRLSKQGLELQEGTWEVFESNQGQLSSHFHESWI